MAVQQPVAAAGAADRRRRAAACGMVVLLLLLLFAEPLLFSTSSDSSSSAASAPTSVDGIPSWLSATSRMAFKLKQAAATRLQASLQDAHAIGFPGLTPPANLSGFFRGVWHVPTTGRPLRSQAYSNSTLLAATFSPAFPDQKLLKASSGTIHMTLAAAPSGIEGVSHVAAAVRIVNGDGSVSGQDVFLTPITGLHVQKTGEIVMVGSRAPPALLFVDTGGACPQAGCNISMVIARAVEAGLPVADVPSINNDAKSVNSTGSDGETSAAAAQSPQERQRALAAVKPRTATQGPLIPTRQANIQSRSAQAAMMPVRKPDVFMFSMPPTRAMDACSVVFSGRVYPSEAVSSISSAGLTVQESASSSSSSLKRSLSSSSLDDRDFQMEDEAMLQPSKHGWYRVFARLLQAGASSTVAKHDQMLSEPLDEPAGLRRQLQDTDGLEAHEASLLQHTANAVASASVSETLSVPVRPPLRQAGPMLSTQEIPSAQVGGAAPLTHSSGDDMSGAFGQLSLQEVLAAATSTLASPSLTSSSAAAAAGGRVGEGEDEMQQPGSLDLQQSDIPSNHKHQQTSSASQLGPENTGLSPALHQTLGPSLSSGGAQHRRTVASIEPPSGTTAQALAETVAETRFAKAMGFTTDFRAPGMGNVGRFFASQRKHRGPEVLLIRGVIRSPDCGFEANATAASVVFNKDAMLRGGIAYGMIMLLLTLLHFGFTVRVILDGITTQVMISRASVLSIGMGAAFDAWLSIAHGMLALAWDDLMGTFALVALLGLLTFSMLEMRLMLSILKEHNPAQFDGMDGVRRAISSLYGRFYAGLFLSMFSIALVSSSAWGILFIASSFWVPQILRSAFYGAAENFDTRYIAVATAVRLFPVLYVLGCPYSFASEMGIDLYSPVYATVLLSWVVIQLVVMRLQRYRGAQFFVPTAFLPQKYDYFRPIYIADARVVPGGGLPGDDDEDTDAPNGAAAGDQAAAGDGAAAGGDEAAGGGGGAAAGDGAPTRLGALMGGLSASMRTVRRRMRRFPLWHLGPAPAPYTPLPQTDQDEADVAEVGAAAPAGVGAGTGLGVSARRDRDGALDLEEGGGHPGARLAPGVVPSTPRLPADEGADAAPIGDDSDPARDPDCVVCMMPIELPAAAGTYMVTPCGHLFHTDCLKQWFDVKMQCPTCRTTVPEP